MIDHDLAAIDDALRPAAEWLGTFALHSTFALAVTWAVARIWRGHALAVQDTLLRQALWLPFVSATLQCWFVGSPWSGFVAAPTRAPLDPAAVMSALAALEESPQGAVAVAAAPTPWALLAVGGGAVAALLGASLLWRSWRRLARVLASRQPETDPRVLSAAAAMAGALGLRQSPRISRVVGLATPIAFGFVRPEICLPARAGALDQASLRAMLGHELAHLRRGDPAWMWLGAWIQALFPWQLLLLPVRREWSRIVELRCDAEAVSHTSPTAVARCLVEVAEWLRPGARVPAAALPMAARPSALRERVEAALRGSAPPRVPHLLAGCLATTSLAALTLAAPGLQPRIAGADATRAIASSSDDGGAALASLLRRVDDEYDALMGEVALLRAELARLEGAEAEALRDRLQRRTAALTQLRARIEARMQRTTEPR